MSAVPPPYTPVYNYQSLANERPGSQLPGAQMDADYRSISSIISEIESRLLEIQNDDGTVKNSSVGVNQLTSDLLNMIKSGPTMVPNSAIINSVLNIASLKALSVVGIQSSYISAKYFSSASDNGGGVFYLSSVADVNSRFGITISVSDDGYDGLWFAANDASGLSLSDGGKRVWVRDFKSEITPDMWGASGNGSTNDTVALNKWIRTAPRIGAVARLPDRTYKANTWSKPTIANKLILISNFGKIIGPGLGITDFCRLNDSLFVNGVTLDGWKINFEYAGTNLVFDFVRIFNSVSLNSSALLFADSSTLVNPTVGDIWIDKCRVYGPLINSGGLDYGSGQGIRWQVNGFERAWVTDCTLTNRNFNAIRIGGFPHSLPNQDGIVITGNFIDGVYSTGQSNGIQSFGRKSHISNNTVINIDNPDGSSSNVEGIYAVGEIVEVSNNIVMDGGVDQGMIAIKSSKTKCVDNILIQTKPINKYHNAIRVDGDMVEINRNTFYGFGAGFIAGTGQAGRGIQFLSSASNTYQSVCDNRFIDCIFSIAIDICSVSGTNISRNEWYGSDATNYILDNSIVTTNSAIHVEDNIFEIPSSATLADRVIKLNASGVGQTSYIKRNTITNKSARSVYIITFPSVAAVVALANVSLNDIVGPYNANYISQFSNVTSFVCTDRLFQYTALPTASQDWLGLQIHTFISSAHGISFCVKTGATYSWKSITLT